MAQPSAGGLPTIINYFYSNKTPEPEDKKAVATLQLRPVDSTLGVLESVDTEVRRREAAIEQLRTRRAMALQEVRRCADAGQQKQALDASKRVQHLDTQIKEKQMLCDTLRKDGEQLERGHETKQTHQLRKAVVEEKKKLVKDMSFKDVDKTAALSEVCDEDVDMMFQRLTGVGVVDEETVQEESMAFLQQLLAEGQTSSSSTTTVTARTPMTNSTKQTTTRQTGRVTNTKIESILNL